MTDNIHDLARRLIQEGRIKKIKKAPPILYPRSIIEEYRKLLLSYLRAYRDGFRELLYPRLEAFESEYMQDDYTDETEDIITSIDYYVSSRFSEQILRGLSLELAIKATEKNKKNFTRTIQRMIGVDIFLDDPNLDRAINSFVTQNVDLIGSIGDEYKRRVRRVISEAARNGYRHEEVAKRLQKEFELTERRAKLIARDQIGKFNGQVNRIRHERVGIKEYIWRNSLDERVRGNPSGRYPKAKHNHWNREGKKFSYRKPPADGNPGEPIQCRCWAEPVIEL